jgi:hypothetical protein
MEKIFICHITRKHFLYMTLFDTYYKIYFVLCECEVPIRTYECCFYCCLWNYLLFCYIFILLYEHYFLQFSGLEVKFTKGILDELKMSCIVTNNDSWNWRHPSFLTVQKAAYKLYYLITEAENRFQYYFYNKKELCNTKRTGSIWNFEVWIFIYIHCKNIILMLILELCLICWPLCCWK